jgi:hypothetical protein
MRFPRTPRGPLPGSVACGEERLFPERRRNTLAGPRRASLGFNVSSLWHGNEIFRLIISPRKTEAMPGFRFINSQGELQVLSRQEGGSGFKYLVRFMLG